MAKASAINVIGGGLAGCEAAYQAARRGARVVIREMKPVRFSPAHSSSALAELVCSNSLKSTNPESASGLLKEEMRLLDSLIIKAAYAGRVPAGESLAVDREAFSAYVTDALVSNGVDITREEVVSLPVNADSPVIIATGPLTSEALSVEIAGLTGTDGLYFFDAVSPIVYRDSIDMDRAWKASRYGKGKDDFINCPLEKDEYGAFVSELLKADRVKGHGFDKMPPFEGCLPIEVMAGRGADTLAFGPMKPVGLVNPRTGIRPHAVVQLRRDNLSDTLYNIVGFQTRLTYPEQKRVFRLIPGLEKAEFARLGKVHRNTYIDSPSLLTPAGELRSRPGTFFAGQITGVEGYCESTASGLIAGINAERVSSGRPAIAPPPVTIIGALLRHVSSSELRPFQPMNANFGLLPPLPEAYGGSVRKKDKKAALAKRAVKELKAWRLLSL